jgi:protein-S-isoprenylcysteine O-methyltransferase Ste14
MIMLDRETPRAAVRPVPGETIWQRTAPESRRRIAGFVSRLAMMLGMLALIALPGRRSIPEMLQLLQTVMAFAGLWSALFAWVAREPPQPGRLNLWDEALAFTGLFLLVRILRTVVFGM